MSEKQFMYILRRVFDEKVTASIRTSSNDYFFGYIVDIGEDYLKMTSSIEKKRAEEFIKLECIESITTEWKEK